MRSDFYGLDMTGRRFGSLVVIGRAPDQIREYEGRTSRKRMWYCQCDCGSPVKTVRGSHLTTGKIVSCGCVGKKNSREAKIKHNQARTRLYQVWCNMKNRCYNPNVRSYKNYGARGITVCDEWRDNFSSFSAWAYSAGYDKMAAYGECTIDRIDVNGPYAPCNCRWVSEASQANNKTNNHRVIYQGKEYTVAELAKCLGIGYSTIYGRVVAGWRDEELVAPKRRKK